MPWYIYLLVVDDRIVASFSTHKRAEKYINVVQEYNLYEIKQYEIRRMRVNPSIDIEEDE